MIDIIDMKLITNLFMIVNVIIEKIINLLLVYSPDLVN